MTPKTLLKQPLMLFTVFLLGFIEPINSQNQPPQTIAEQLDYGFKTKICRLNDSTEVAYQKMGKSKGQTPLLFIHGLGSYMRVWDKNIAVLAEKRLCFRLDLPGYGRSSKGYYAANMSFYAQIIRDFCTKKGLKKVILVGHSMGGQIAITTALREPALIEKIVLLNPAGFETFTESQAAALGALMTPEAVAKTPDAQIVRNLANNFFNMTDDALFMAKDRQKMSTASDFMRYAYVISQNIRGMLSEPVFKALPSVEAPVLVIFGEKDGLIPNQYFNPKLTTAAVMAAGCGQLRRAKCDIVPEAGHMSMWEKPEAINKIIMDFLKS